MEIKWVKVGYFLMNKNYISIKTPPRYQLQWQPTLIFYPFFTYQIFLIVLCTYRFFKKFLPTIYFYLFFAFGSGILLCFWFLTRVLLFQAVQNIIVTVLLAFIIGYRPSSTDCLKKFKEMFVKHELSVDV